MENALRSEDQAQRENGNYDFADRTDSEGTKALFGKFAEIGAQSDSCKREQKRPAGKIRERSDLLLVEDGKRCEQ